MATSTPSAGRPATAGIRSWLAARPSCPGGSRRPGAAWPGRRWTFTPAKRATGLQW